MLTEEDDVEIHALARRGWSVSAIARHTGRDRKTVRKYLAAPGAVREPAESCLESLRAYLVARLADDAHVDATVLYREVLELGLDRSYVMSIAIERCRMMAVEKCRSASVSRRRRRVAVGARRVGP